MPNLLRPWLTNNGLKSLIILLVAIDDARLVHAHPIRLAHQTSALDSRHIRYNKLVLVCRILCQIKFDILSLNQISELVVHNLDRTVVHEDVLAILLSTLDCYKSIASFVVKPLYASS